MRCDIYIRQVLRNPRDRAVKITVNEQLVDFVMKLGSTGQAYFVEETDEPPAEEEMTSPILSPHSPHSLQPGVSDDIAGPMPSLSLRLDEDGEQSASPRSEGEEGKEHIDGAERAWFGLGNGAGKKGRRTGRAGEEEEENLGGDDVFLEEFLLQEMRRDEVLLQQRAAEEGSAAADAPSSSPPASRFEVLNGGPALQPGASEGAEVSEPSTPELHGGVGSSLSELEGSGLRQLSTFCGAEQDAPLCAEEIVGAATAEAEREDAEDAAGEEAEEAEEAAAARAGASAPVSRDLLLQLLDATSDVTSLVKSETPKHLREGGAVVARLDGCTDPPQRRLRLSLCGRFLQQSEMTLKEQRAVFEAHLVTVEAFHANPLDIASNPELFVQIDGDMYRWQIMAPALISALAFGCPLPLQTHQQLCTLDSRYSLFQPPGRRLATAADGAAGDEDDQDAKDFSYSLLRRIGVPPQDEEPPAQHRSVCTARIFVSQSAARAGTEELGGDEGGDTPGGGALDGRGKKLYERKTLHPSQEQLASLPLRPGANTICFYISHKASSPPVTASIFLWSYKSKVVISDVDGTITKSDVMGHLLPRVGIQWAQKGVPQLLQAITNNDYKVLYLTARPIGQVDTTKAYLRSVTEDGVHLPLGPVITSPDGVFKSINREIIQRKPEEFKIECLNKLRNLVPQGCHIEHCVHVYGCGSHKGKLKNDQNACRD